MEPDCRRYSANECCNGDDNSCDLEINRMTTDVKKDVLRNV